MTTTRNDWGEEVPAGFGAVYAPDDAQIPPASCVCIRCGHDWEPRHGVPNQCPYCQTFYWNKPQLILRCERCGHTWHPRINAPRQCPGCRSYKWRVPKPPKPPKRG